MAPSKTETRTLTGADGAYVNVITKVRDKEIITQAFVQRGEELPKHLAEGELERLEEAGAFGETTHRERQVRARARRNQLRGAIVGEGSTNNPKTPDMTAPPPGTQMARPMTQAEVEGGATTEGGATPPPATTEEDDGLEASNMDELKKVADTENVEYDSKVKKADLIKAIRDARAAEETS